MIAFLALASALLYGGSDFLGGLASRRAAALPVLLVSTPAGLLGLAVAAAVVPGHPALAALGWGALAGLAGGSGVVAFYQALASGAMTVVAPTSALVAAAVPVGVGLALGERPGAAVLAGVALCVGAAALVGWEPAGHGAPLPRRRRRRALALAVAAGAGFGLFLVFLRPVAPADGLWPLVGARAVAWAVVGLAAGTTGQLRLPGTGGARLSVAAGALDAAANISYLLAVQHGSLVVVAVLSSLYPAVTVVLAGALLGERLRGLQKLGLAVALAGVLLVGLA